MARLRQSALLATFLFLCTIGSEAFTPPGRLSRRVTFLRTEPIVSPFDDTSGASAASTGTTTATEELGDGPLDLTWENVELVLDSMRSYLIQDGGNVSIKDIDGPVVKLQLEVSALLRIVSSGML